MQIEFLNIAISVIITSIITGSITYALTMRSRIKALFSSQCSQLRIQILELSRKCLAREEVTYEELDALTKAYENYHALGGNGTITKIYEDVKELPIRSITTINSK